jgi:cell division protein YceG involved in septum cleavage
MKKLKMFSVLIAMVFCLGVVSSVFASNNVKQLNGAQPEYKQKISVKDSYKPENVNVKLNKTEKQAYGKLVGAKIKVSGNKLTFKGGSIIAKDAASAKALQKALSKAKTPEEVYKLTMTNYNQVKKFTIKSNGIEATVSPKKGKQIPHSLWDSKRFGV